MADSSENRVPEGLLVEGAACDSELERLRFLHQVYLVAWRILSPRQLQVLVSYLEEPALTCRQRAAILHTTHSAVLRHRKRMLKRIADVVGRRP